MTNMKKLTLVLALAALVALALPAVASANFAIHGNYVLDDDACAGCHRAHTSIASVTWSDVADNEHSALLVSSATELWEFCYACHDATSQGADTNVQEGVYEGTLYGSQFSVLNGGGFESLDTSAATSWHMYNGASWGAYGGGYTGGGLVGATGQINNPDGSPALQGASVDIKMDCGSCHDPHGSPNYRILKSYVNGNYVGGYQPSGNPQDPDPDGYVSSVETGWPVNGFRLHQDYPNYKPNYTTPMYAKGYDQSVATTANGATGLDDARGMSGWCAGCHSTYLQDITVQTKSDGTTYSASASVYNAGDGFGLRLRHRHPINVELDTYNAADKASMIVTDNVLPLAHGMNEQGTPSNQAQDWIECLTCHRAHGTAATMSGYAADPGAYDLPGFPTAQTGNAASALLRRDNRGVCEACHNK